MSLSDPNLSPDELVRARRNVELKAARIRRNRRLGQAGLTLAVATGGRGRGHPRLWCRGTRKQSAGPCSNPHVETG
jgi:hypothetical protein